jgi:hypothetical protein
MADLKKYMPSYEKGGIKNIYHVIRKDISSAITHAKRAGRHCESGDTDMPSTQVYVLVEYLQQLKKR